MRPLVASGRPSPNPFLNEAYCPPEAYGWAALSKSHLTSTPTAGGGSPALAPAAK
jgi:hypothetical protein